MMRKWTREERDKQSELIRGWKPWARSTGPKTSQGKTASSKNALAHGAYSYLAKEEARQISGLLKECKKFLIFKT
jgi:hypothetical protein